MYKVFNIHFTEICYYKCSYCFGAKNNRQLEFNDLKAIIDNIKRYYMKNQIIDGRINLAGGEPLCSRVLLQDVIDYIHSQGILVSIITNGSLLTSEFISLNRTKIYMLGISIDSLDEQLNRKIGRCDKDKQVLRLDKIVTLCKKIKEEGIRLKINICVSKYNYTEDFSELLSKIEPDRFKILQMTIKGNVSEHCKSYCVDGVAFEDFCSKHRGFSPIVESNDMIKNGYLLVNSQGYIGVDDSHNDQRHNLKESELYDIIQEIGVDRGHYQERYVGNNAK